MAAQMLLNALVTFKIMPANVAFVRIDSFHSKFGDKRPGGLIALGALTRFIGIIRMLFWAFKVGENVPASGTLIRDHQPFGRVTQSMSGPFMLA